MSCNRSYSTLNNYGYYRKTCDQLFTERLCNPQPIYEFYNKSDHQNNNEKTENDEYSTDVSVSFTSSLSDLIDFNALY